MNNHDQSRRRATGRAAAAALAVAVAAPAALPAIAAGPAELTKRGVGGIKVGAKYDRLRDRDLVRRARGNCGGLRSAKLKNGLRGKAFFTRDAPSRVDSVRVRGGAEADGVGFGDTRADIRAAFPHAEFITGAEERYGVTIAQIPERDGGMFQFGIDTDSKRIAVMGVPYLWFCS